MGKKLGIGFGVIMLLIVGAYFGMQSDPVPDTGDNLATSETQTIQRPEERREIPEPSAEVTNTYQLSGILPALDSSDEMLFDHLGMLLSSVRLSLLNDEQFIRKLVLQIDNVARGELIYQHSPLLTPEGIMETAMSGEQLVIDPTSYARYNAYGDLVASVDTGLLVAFYRFYEPLLDEAYAEMGYPEGSFRGAFIKAIDQALAAPVIDGVVALAQPEANYVYADETLESLNMVQKQLLRMGPENTAKIQQALQQFKARIQ